MSLPTNIFSDDWGIFYMVDATSQIETIFNPDIVHKAFETKISHRASRGIDGTTLKNFIIDKEAVLIGTKCIDGTFKFTPYLQRLKLKGKGKPPREIAIPTIRDQVVLYILKEYLHAIFPECVNTALPNKVIRDISNYLQEESSDPTLCFSKYDIDNFYGSIKHNILLEFLEARIKSTAIVKLIMDAVKNITVSPTARKREYRSFKHFDGVPQGLSISNILANIYIRNFDGAASKNSSKYFRYVDDILIFNAGDNKACVKPVVADELSKLGLKVSEGKTCCKSVKPAFDYLGYLFEYPNISIKQGSIDKFVRSIAAKFTYFKTTSESLERNHKWMTQELYNQVFIEELNLRVTGAISSKKRYGWIFYFLEMNDLTLLKRLDNVIYKFFLGCGHFTIDDAIKLKTLTRTYFEARHTPLNGYIHNYDLIVTTQEQLNYLIKMGIIDRHSNETLSTEQVSFLFEKTKGHLLSLLELDIGGFS